MNCWFFTNLSSFSSSSSSRSLPYIPPNARSVKERFLFTILEYKKMQYCTTSRTEITKLEKLNFEKIHFKIAKVQITLLTVKILLFDDIQKVCQPKY